MKLSPKSVNFNHITDDKQLILRRKRHLESGFYDAIKNQTYLNVHVFLISLEKPLSLPELFRIFKKKT
ncbi:hypothetical protein HanXRQr2_Chr16g0762821 [Helianthus annuus]|uniref:Uncharacterized protein n=1 Tax=Helianthus annuus TaxID=4232 RepID=A0A9K3GZ83_HELAN|nr:hypothetical protein HanXRQr2_Chr16g0762821 [Helianthus annuus]KAJ0822346.1 hypothetical protein HanPSC8_Chr16g0730931 [Helianthus annuus]